VTLAAPALLLSSLELLRSCKCAACLPVLCAPADVNEAAITTLQLNGTDVAMTTDNAYVLQQIAYEMLGDVTSAPVSITKPLVRSQAACCSSA
jgi:hypothetical protein